ncbi:MAG TPA: NUDIX domain-containing protein [Bryobacteraceae bacterium]|nr:NUDIX domain-containing protein [Bryobacteraceae bacterium]
MHNVEVLSIPAVIELLRRTRFDHDGEAVKSSELTLALLNWSPAPFSRKTYQPGHLTCTGVVLNPAMTHFLLVHHRRLDRWLLPGGHVEDEDRTPACTARREVLEETGAELDGAQGLLVGCDVHAIPSRSREPMHLHHDLIFAFQAHSGNSSCSPESRAVVWRNVQQTSDLPLPIKRSVDRALAMLG